jgi:hypothetical protein
LSNDVGMAGLTSSAMCACSAMSVMTAMAGLDLWIQLHGTVGAENVHS